MPVVAGSNFATNFLGGHRCNTELYDDYTTAMTNERQKTVIKIQDKK